jgi:hypothetical protein
MADDAEPYRAGTERRVMDYEKEDKTKIVIELRTALGHLLKELERVKSSAEYQYLFDLHKLIRGEYRGPHWGEALWQAQHVYEKTAPDAEVLERYKAWIATTQSTDDLMKAMRGILDLHAAETNPKKYK